MAISLLLFVSLFLSVASLSGPPDPVLNQGAEWHVETVDSDSFVDDRTSLALDSKGNPHVAYNDGGMLKYVSWTDEGWDIEIVYNWTLDYGISLALDKSDNPHISFHDVAFADLRYAKRDGSNWSVEVVDTDGMVGIQSSIAVDTQNNPHISYYNASSGTLKYAKLTGGSWKKARVSNELAGVMSCITTDNSNTPHISYYEHNPLHDLKYAKLVGLNWVIERVDSLGDVGLHSSIALDSNGVPHIGYWDYGNDDLKYANRTGGSWKNLTVDSEDSVGNWNSIAIDGNDYPHISYYNSSSADLKYANWTQTGWNIETIDSVGAVGARSSIGLDVRGNPHVSYLDTGGDDLKYATTARLGPRPPRMLQAILDGDSFENITIAWSLSADDGLGFGSVVSYEVLRNRTYNPDRIGYQLVTTLPNGTTQFSDRYVGEGDSSDYFYSVCSLDSEGKRSCSKVQAAKYTRPLSKGPSLVSIPLIRSDENLQTVLQTLSYDKAWSYDSINQEWKSFSKSKPYGQSLEYLNHTMGIWVNVTQDSNLTVAGLVPTSTTIDLQVGWNLVGFPSFDDNYTVADLKGAVSVERIEGFDGLVPPYFLRVMVDGDLLQAGFGFWIKVESPAIWTVQNV